VGAALAARVIPLVGLLVIATVSNTEPEIDCAIYLVLIGLAALGVALFIDNLGTQRSNLGAMAEALRYRHSWVMSFLYIGTFASFIGFSFAFGQVLQINFLAGGDNAAQASLHAAQIAFIGPLLGSISRPFGGKLSDRIGGGKVTLYTFIAMIFAAGILVVTGMIDDGMTGAATGLTNDRVRRRFHPAVHTVGHRQRVDVQDDPVDLRGQGAGPRRVES
jgi:MFS transporter, NNP family, nitrate/nitrite transporter